MYLVHELVKADTGDLIGDHHDAEDHGEEGASQLPLIGHQRVGCQCGKVHRESSSADGNDEGVYKAHIGVKGFAVKDGKVVHKIVGGDEGDGVGLYLHSASGGVDHHDNKGHDAQNSKENTNHVGHDLEAAVAGFQSFLHYLLPPFLSRIRKNTTTEQAAMIRNIIMEAAAARLYI